MIRRSKLTPAERARRAEKRARRAERPRPTERVRFRGSRTTLLERLVEARKRYDAAVRIAATSERSSVVCLTCGLEQRYVDNDEWSDERRVYVEVAPCRSDELLGFPCPGLVCESAEAYSEP